MILKSLSALLLFAAGTPALAGDHPVTAVIEIPAGSSIKYERDAAGRIFVDRFLTAPVAYPLNYGAIPGTRQVMEMSWTFWFTPASP